jgi:uncharacterized membrane protein YccF (DUF307 family)
VTAHMTATVIESNDQPGCLISALWFIFIGSWLSAVWIFIAWILTVLIITMPVGLAMMNRIPAVTTLQRY